MSKERSYRGTSTLTEAVNGGWTIAVSCKACAHRRVVGALPLLALARAKMWDDSFIVMSNRMRCAKCGQKWSSMEATDEPADDGGSIGPVSEQAFKALIRRLR